MKIISHRGNLNGPCDDENKPKHIQHALDKGYDVEVDVHCYQDNLWLGHDNSQYKINLDFLLNKHIWCHIKGVECLSLLYSTDVNYFFHSADDLTITSKGFLWHHPNSNWKYLTPLSIAVCPEKNNFDLGKSKIYGVCTDYVSNYEK